MSKRILAAVLAPVIIVGGLLAAPALAHHSFAMFEATKTITLKGTVKELHWKNPHIWIDVNVQKGKAVEVWGIEAGATQTMLRRGWKRDSLKPGDKITAIVRPMRNGSPAGSLQEITKADGTKLTLGAQGKSATPY